MKGETPGSALKPAFRLKHVRFKRERVTSGESAKAVEVSTPICRGVMTALQDESENSDNAFLR